MGSDLFDSELPVLGGITDVIARRILQEWELLSEPVDRFQGLVDAERRLAEPGKSRRIAYFQLIDIGRRLHQRDMRGRLAGGPLDLFVPRVSDQQDLEIVLGEPFCLVVHLGHQRAGCVNCLEPSLLGLQLDCRRHPMRREHHRRALGDLIEVLDEDGAPLLQVLHYVPVVHDLFADIDRWPIGLQRFFDGNHRTVHAGAVPARRGQHDLPWAARRSCLGGLGHPVSVGAAAGHWIRSTDDRTAVLRSRRGPGILTRAPATVAGYCTRGARLGGATRRGLGRSSAD